MKLETKKEIDAQVHAAEGKGFFSKLAGNEVLEGGVKKLRILFGSQLVQNGGE